MAYYNLCDKCGCTLDPGEKCDCEQKMQKKEQDRQKMIFADQNGQMTFTLTKEERILEKAVV